MAVSPILVRPLTNPSRRGQFSNVTGIFDDKHTGMATGTLTLETITQEERNGDWRRPRDANPRRAARGPCCWAQDYRAGIASFGATSLKWTPVGSAASASRP